MAHLKGTTLTLLARNSTVHIDWKQGGSRSQDYNWCTYKCSGGDTVAVYVQASFGAPKQLKVDQALQWGKTHSGIFFIVYHDKSQRPFQHRFLQTGQQDDLKKIGGMVEGYTGGIVDIGGISGDYLHTF